MFDGNDDAKASYRRVELLTGPGRRRRWSLAEKAQIVAEAMEPGAKVSEVARRWQLCSQQVFGWRRAARAGLLALPVSQAVACPAMSDFVPIIVEPAPPVLAAVSACAIEVEVAGVVVRVRPGLDDALLTAVLRAVRASAGGA